MSKTKPVDMAFERAYGPMTHALLMHTGMGGRSMSDQVAIKEAARALFNKGREAGPCDACAKAEGTE